MGMKYNILEPKEGDIVQLTSYTWYVFINLSWRLMKVEEQIEASK